MRNKYLAKVLVANKFVSEEQIRKYLPLANANKDIGMLLVDASLIDMKTYNRVLQFVLQLEEKAKKQDALKTQAATFARREEPQAVKPKQVPVKAESKNTELQIEGNNLYGSSVSSNVQVEKVEGLESTALEGGFQIAEKKETSQALPDSFILESGMGKAPLIPEVLKTTDSLSVIMAYARNYQVSDIYLYENRPIVFSRFLKLVPVTENFIDANRLSAWLLEASNGFTNAYAPSIGKNFCKTFALPGVGRARLSVLWKNTTPSISIRLIPMESVSFENLCLPEFCKDFVALKQGLVLIAGQSFSGKTTTLTTFGESIANNQYVFLETIEERIERLLLNPNGAVIQKEVGLHISSTTEGIRTAIEEGVNVLLFDSLSTIEELKALLMASGAGILVFATTCSNDLISLFNHFLENAEEEKANLCQSLAAELKGAIVQHLIPVSGGEGLILATESFKTNATISNILRKGEITQLPGALASMKDQAISLDDSLETLVHSGYIEGFEAWLRAFDKRRFASYKPKGI